ncbi:MAG: hypothetical protein ACXVEF_06780 [Polyangiales bacterium]
MLRWKRSVSILFALSIGGCSGSDFETASTAEADSANELEAAPETSSSDTGEAETAIVDSELEASADSGMSDEGVADSLSEPADTGTIDIDSALVDSSSPDTSSPDTSVADSFVSEVLVDVGVDTFKPCDVTKTPSEDACVLRDDLGIFVSATKGNDANPGTKTSPVKTLAQAQTLAKLGKHRVYACAETFVEQVALRDGVSLFGGIDCTSFTVTGKTIVAPLASPAMTGKSIANVRIDRFDVRSPDAPVGQSSIAVLLDTASAIVFVDSSISSGLGGGGAPGSPGAVGAVGDGGGDGPVPRSTFGCPSSTKTSPGGVPGTKQSAGGAGASLACNTNPAYGKDAPLATATCGIGGATNSTMCLETPPGCDGGKGTDSAGAIAMGSFSAAGYAPAAAGGTGTIGTVGTGGGGGGSGMGTKGGDTGGGGGGGGGAGGGGAGGAGGASAGASIGMLSNASDVTLARTPIATKGGGTGGTGGAGGLGGEGGAPGKGGKACAGTACPADGCAGGKGGRGGAGGAGGGGAGGPSIGVAYHGTAPALDGASTITLGAGGAGGASTGHAGAKGTEKATLAF